MVYRFVGSAAPSETSTERPGKPEPAHRARAGRPGRAAWLARAVAVAVVGVLVALAPSERAAFAFCRTTTCAVQKPPPSCTRDLSTGCWQAVSDFHRGPLASFFMIPPWLSLFSSEVSMLADTGHFAQASSHEK